jgi:hypothetical protein
MLQMQQEQVMDKRLGLMPKSDIRLRAFNKAKGLSSKKEHR